MTLKTRIRKRNFSHLNVSHERSHVNSASITYPNPPPNNDIIAHATVMGKKRYIGLETIDVPAVAGKSYAARGGVITVEQRWGRRVGIICLMAY